MRNCTIVILKASEIKIEYNDINEENINKILQQ